MFLAQLRQLIRNNRSNVIIILIAAFCTKYLRAYFNEGYFDMSRNGEARVLERALGYFKEDKLIVLDIGANQGSWTSAVLNNSPNAKVFCFEIIPATAASLKAKFSSFPDVHVCDFGLSSGESEVDVYWNKTSNDTSAISPRHSDPLFTRGLVEKIRCKVEAGDSVISRLNIDRIDLMKIDVEGHEVSVLEGFGKTLAEKGMRPSIIQFEYGETYIPSRHNLYEVYELLEKHGYTIGRIFPKGVDFKKYAFADDHFRMGNYLAIQTGSSLEALMRKF